jgi:hypothetical protein
MYLTLHTPLEALDCDGATETSSFPSSPTQLHPRQQLGVGSSHSIAFMERALSLLQKMEGRVPQIRSHPRRSAQLTRWLSRNTR